jgi:hypothetical protein
LRQLARAGVELAFKELRADIIYYLAPDPNKAGSAVQPTSDQLLRRFEARLVCES